jgi:acylphosphatase
MIIHAEILVHGMVQGVGYRYFVMGKAHEYGLNGYVKNLGNGDVLVEVEGEQSIIKDFTKELRIGPRFARVIKVDINISPNLYNYKRFEVRF